MDQITDMEITGTYRGVTQTKLISVREAMAMSNVTRQAVHQRVKYHGLARTYYQGERRLMLIVQSEWEKAISKESK